MCACLFACTCVCVFYSFLFFSLVGVCVCACLFVRVLSFYISRKNENNMTSRIAAPMTPQLLMPQPTLAFYSQNDPVMQPTCNNDVLIIVNFGINDTNHQSTEAKSTYYEMFFGVAG